MKKDATFKWDDKEFVEFYTQSADVIMLERQRCIKLFLEIVSFHFKNTTNLHILDLGCGNGVITKYIYDRSPDNNFYLIDASKEMLAKAKENLPDDSISFQHLSFEDYCDLPPEDAKYDLVFSANAIHHLDFLKKAELFSKIYKELQFGGLFLNTDPVHPSSAGSEAIQFAIWRNWMNETLANNKHQEDIGKYDHIPGVYKNNLENKPSSLFDQLQLLTNCGFRDVDCFYKYSIFALFGGIKS